MLQIQEVHPVPHSNACYFLSFFYLFFKEPTHTKQKKITRKNLIELLECIVDPDDKERVARSLLSKIRGFYTKLCAYYRTVLPQTIYFRYDRK
jgi:hypothetical protein